MVILASLFYLVYQAESITANSCSSNKKSECKRYNDVWKEWNSNRWISARL